MLKKKLSLTKKVPPDPGIDPPDPGIDPPDPGIDPPDPGIDPPNPDSDPDSDPTQQSPDNINLEPTTHLSGLATSVRKLENNISSFTTIVLKLNSILRKKNKQAFRSHILKVVETINRMSLLTHYFINLHVHRIISEHPPPPSATDINWYKQLLDHMPPLNEQNWHNQVCNTIIPLRGPNKDKEDPELKKTLEIFNSLYPEGYQLPNRRSLGAIQNFMSEHILWSVKKHIINNMPNRINTFLKVCYSISNPGLRTYIVERIMNGPSEFESKFDTDLDAQKIINMYKDFFTVEQEVKKVIKKRKKADQKEISDKLKKGQTSQDLKDEIIKEQEGKHYVKKKKTEEDKKKKALNDKKEKDMLSKYLLFQYQMLSEIEKVDGKKWSLLPQKGSFVDGHISLSPDSMVDLLKSECLEDKTKTRKHFKDMESKIWDEIFILPPNRGPYLFKEYMTTNGYVACINYVVLPGDFAKVTQTKNYHDLTLEGKYNVLTKYQEVKKKQNNVDAVSKKEQKEKNAKDQEAFKTKSDEQREKDVKASIEHEFTRILGLDPGNRSLFTCIDKSVAGKKTDGQVLRCGSNEYKHLTGMKKKTKNINKRKERVPVLKGLGKNVSLKTSNYEKYKENLKNLLAVEENVLKEYQRLWYRKINFTGYIKKQKAFKILADRLQGNHEQKKVLIGWGNGGDGSRLKGTKVPGKGFKSYIENNTKMKVVDVDENLTTKKCSKCHEDTKNMYELKDVNAGKRRAEARKEAWRVKEAERVEKEDERIRLLREKKLGIKMEKRVREAVSDKVEYEVVMKKVKVYGIKQCVNCGITWDRDVNAPENILRVLLCQLRKEARPAYLCRKGKSIPGAEIAVKSSECPALDSQGSSRGSITNSKQVILGPSKLSFKKRTVRDPYQVSSKQVILGPSKLSFKKRTVTRPVSGQEIKTDLSHIK